MTAITYPGAISRACAALDEIAEFRAMPDGYLRVLIRIVKKINLATFTAPIRASRFTLATESGKSVETVGRVIRWLEDKELIQRQQKARPGLRGSESPIIPTPKLLIALQITGPTDTEKPAVLPVKTDGSISVPRQQSFGEQHAERRAPFARVEGKTLPSDLAALCSQGLRATGVLALMREAKKGGKRLSDVVAATRQYIAGLEGRELFAYLLALVRKDKDYARQVSETAKAQDELQQRKHLVEKADAMRGRRYQTRDGRMQVEIMANGIVSVNEQGRGHYSSRFDQSWLDAIEAGKLRAISVDCNDCA